jgi:hypothetical protein
LPLRGERVDTGYFLGKLSRDNVKTQFDYDLYKKDVKKLLKKYLAEYKAEHAADEVKKLKEEFDDLLDDLPADKNELSRKLYRLGFGGAWEYVADFGEEIVPQLKAVIVGLKLAQDAYMEQSKINV